MATRGYMLLNFQLLLPPNGLIANLYGSVEGRRHDSAIWSFTPRSNILSHLLETFYVYMGTQPILIGYSFSAHMREKPS